MQLRDNRLFEYDKELLQRLSDGVKAISRIVGTTLGPRGANVLIEPRYSKPVVTKDGFTVAAEVFLEDSVANMAAQLVKEASHKSNDLAGDGTTSTVVLADAIFHEGKIMIEAGASPLELRASLLASAHSAVSKLKEKATPVEGEGLRRVATISANDTAVGDLVFKALGDDPKRVVVIEEASGFESEVENVDGLRVERGILSPYLVTDRSKGQTVLENAAVFVTSEKLSSLDEALQIMQVSLQNGYKELFVVADEIEGPALECFSLHAMKGVIKVAAIKAPGFGTTKIEMLGDIAAVAGATIIGGSGVALEKITINDYGHAKKVVSDREATTLLGGGGDKKQVAARIEDVRTLLSETESVVDKANFEKRMALLGGGVTIIRVGAATESEVKETKQRVEDAVRAVVAAHEEGIVPGAGSTLAVIAKDFEGSSVAGDRILAVALGEPYRKLLKNAGVTDMPDPVWDVGYDFRDMQPVTSLMASGVIDPAKVLRVAIENAASVASSLFSAGGSIVFKEKAKSSRDLT
jgi:chaperonin GroEL